MGAAPDHWFAKERARDGRQPGRSVLSLVAIASTGDEPIRPFAGATRRVLVGGALVRHWAQVVDGLPMTIPGLHALAIIGVCVGVAVAALVMPARKATRAAALPPAILMRSNEGPREGQKPRLRRGPEVGQ